VVLHLDRSSNDLGKNQNNITVEPPQPCDASLPSEQIAKKYIKKGEIESTSDQTIVKRGKWLGNLAKYIVYFCLLFWG